MRRYAFVLFVLALLAAMYGFGHVRPGVAAAGKVLSAVFLIGAIVTAFAHQAPSRLIG